MKNLVLPCFVDGVRIITQCEFRVISVQLEENVETFKIEINEHRYKKVRFNLKRSYNLKRIVLEASVNSKTLNRICLYFMALTR